MKFLRKENLAYLYRLEQHHFPDYLEVIIQDKARPECCIYVDVLEDSALVAGFSEWFVEKSVASLVDYAQKKGWLKERKELYLRLDSRQVGVVNRSLAQERAICAAFFESKPRPDGAIWARRIQQLQQVSEDLDCPLPSWFYFLYGFGGEQGGFGPDYGFLPLYGPLDLEREQFSLFGLYQALSQNEKHRPRLLPFLHWGSGLFSVLDCSLPEFPIWVYDANRAEQGRPWVDCFWRHLPSFELWFQRFLSEADNGQKLYLEMLQQHPNHKNY